MIHRRSKIGRLPREIREQINEFMDAHTEYQRIIDWLAERGQTGITGLGMQLAERAQERFGRTVEPLTFTAAIKAVQTFFCSSHRWSTFSQRLIQPPVLPLPE